MEEAVGGENPALGGEMLTMVEFNAAVICIHGYTIAPPSDSCYRPNWLDCLVRPHKLGECRAVRRVVDEFSKAKKIPSFLVIRRHIKEKQRQIQAVTGKKTEAPKPKDRTYKKWSIIAGLAVVSGILLFEGGKLVLKLLVKNDNKEDKNPK